MDLLSPGADRRARPLVFEALCALLAATALVVLLGRVTNRIEPAELSFDEKLYVKMAAEGPLEARPRTAPFAYRPGTVLVVRGIARIAGIPPERAYAVLTAGALPIFLALLYFLARLHTRSKWRAVVATLLAGLSYSTVKRLLFNPISPDGLGLVLVTLGAILVAQGRMYALAGVTAAGVLCREFVLLPALAAALQGLGHIRSRWQEALRALVPLGAGLLVAGALRLAIRVESTAQHVDPLVAATWGNALQVFDTAWFLNAAGACLTFLWPLSVVPWRHDNTRGVLPPWLRIYALALAGVVLFAGSNFMWIVAYFAPFLVVAWVVKAPSGRSLDLVLLWLVMVVNRTLEPIPSPRNFDAYVGHMAFFGSRLDLSTGVRALVLAAAVATYLGLATLVREGSQSRRPEAGP